METRTVLLVLAYQGAAAVGYLLWVGARLMAEADARHVAHPVGVSAVRCVVFATATALMGSALIAEPDGGISRATWPFVVVLPLVAVLPLALRRRSVRRFRTTAKVGCALFGILALVFLPLVGVVWIPVSVLLWRASQIAKFEQSLAQTSLPE